MIAPDDTTFEWVEGRARRAARTSTRRSPAGASCAPTTARRSTREIAVDAARALAAGHLGHEPRRMVVAGHRAPCPSRAPRRRRARAEVHGARARHADAARSRSTACSSARARTRRIGDLRAAAEVVEGRKVASDVDAMVVPGSAAGARAGRGRGPRRGLPRRRLRLAHRRLLDVPGHEPGHPAARASAAPRPRTATSRAARAAAGARTSSRPQMAAAAAIEGRFVDIREWS